MGYELKPNNRGVASEVILEDLRRVAGKGADRPLTMREYREKGRFHPSTVARRFGSWNKALAMARLQLAKPSFVGEAVALADLRRLAEQLGRTTLTRSEYDARGTYGSKAVANRFGGWLPALSADAGGETEIGNLWTLCQRCNGGKSNLPLQE